MSPGEIDAFCDEIIRMDNLSLLKLCKDMLFLAKFEAGFKERCELLHKECDRRGKDRIYHIAEDEHNYDFNRDNRSKIVGRPRRSPGELDDSESEGTGLFEESPDGRGKERVQHVAEGSSGRSETGQRQNP